MWRINGVSMPGFGVACVVGVIFLVFRGGLPLWTASVVFALTWLMIDSVAAWQLARKQAREKNPDEPPR